MCLGVSEPAERLAAQNTAYALRNWQGKQAIVKKRKKNEKNEKKKSKSVRSLRCMNELFSQLMATHYLKVVYNCKVFESCL